MPDNAIKVLIPVTEVISKIKKVINFGPVFKNVILTGSVSYRSSQSAGITSSQNKAGSTR